MPCQQWKEMRFLKLSAMTHAFRLASADAGTLLTGDLRESFSDSSDMALPPRFPYLCLSAPPIPALACGFSL